MLLPLPHSVHSIIHVQDVKGDSMRTKVSKKDVIFALERTCCKKKYDSYDGGISYSRFNQFLKNFVRQLYNAGILSKDDLLVMAAQDKAIHNLCVELGVL